MKVGLTRYEESERWSSLQQVFRMIEHSLRQRYELVYFPRRGYSDTEEKRKADVDSFIKKCDVIINRDNVDVYEARQRFQKQIPTLHFLLGEMPRGAPCLAKVSRYITTADVLVANCAGDIAIVKKFFSNASVEMISFAVDHEGYYPLDEQQRRAIRTELGFKDEDNILLYIGRVTLEKNFHTVLRIFSIIQQLIPNTYLLVVGPILGIPFLEFGLYPLELRKTIERMIQKLDIPLDHIRLVGRINPDEAVVFYNIADVVVNLTLHHDENFGYVQVESMACGTPVVGTRWGGLKETIVDGVTGYHANTFLTPLGVKIDWWTGLNRIVYLLKYKEEREQFKERVIQYAREKYHYRNLADNLHRVITQLIENKTLKGEPLRLTQFGGEYWIRCVNPSQVNPPYRRGPRSYQMYRKLIAPYTGSPNGCEIEGKLNTEDIFILASPVSQPNESQLIINDPLYPMEVVIPASHREIVGTIIQAMLKHPAIHLGDLMKMIGKNFDMFEALKWAVHNGVLLRVQPEQWCVSPTEVDWHMSIPLFSIHKVGSPCDIVLLD